MTYIDALNACNLDEATLNELYAYMDYLTETDVLECIHHPIYLEKLIEIIIKPDTVLVRSILSETYTPFLDRVLIYKDHIRAPLSTCFPNEYTFLKRLTGT